jgi:hypothetical protein
VARTRAYRSRWLWIPAAVISATAQGTAIVTYQATRPTPKPLLTIRLDGDGDGQVLVTRTGDAAPILRCAHPLCSIEVAPNTQVKLTAVLGDGATFAGYRQYPMRTPAALVPWLGDPVGDCSAGDALTAAAHGDVLDCPVTVKADTDVSVEFGLQPHVVEVAFADPGQLDKLIKPLSPPPPPSPIDAETLDEKPIEVAVTVKPPKLIQPPPLLPAPEDKKPPPPPQPPPPNMTMVEVKDKNVVDKAADDAKFLSDKNRDVAEETRATKTNLDKESEGQAEASR